MPKKSHIRTLMDSQHVEASKTLHKSSLQYICHIFWSIWKEISSKNSVLVVSETLRLFVNTFTPNDKYSLSVKVSVEINQFKCNYLQIKKYFLTFFLNFWNLHKIWNTMKKMMTLRGFWNYTLQQAQLLKCPNSSALEQLWTINKLKGPKHCINLHGSIFVIFFNHSETKWAGKALF